MDEDESKEGKIEWVREKTLENLKAEEALSRFVKAEIRRSKIERLKGQKVLKARFKEREWKCPRCKIDRKESINLDTLVYTYEGSTMPQFFCQGCGFVNPPGDWIEQQWIRNFSFFVRKRLKERTRKKLYKKYSKFSY